MVLNRKAQGLPLHLIVIAAIAALVLVLVIAFTIGGFGSFFGKIFGAGQTVTGDATDVAKTVCSGYCDTAKGSMTTTGFEMSQYCSKTFDIDVNGDGELKAEDKEVNIHCWDSPISVHCSTTISGQTCSDTEDGCECVAPATGPVCGDGTCDDGETAENCPADCE